MVEMKDPNVVEVSKVTPMDDLEVRKGEAMLKVLPLMPHTTAKHLLLRRNLDRWFPIFGNHEKATIYLVDFAGPGELLIGDGSSSF